MQKSKFFFVCVWWRQQDSSISGARLLASGSGACSVTEVTAVQFCTGVSETVRVRACWRNKRQQGLLCIVKNKNKQRGDTKCLLRYTRCITQAVASNRRTPKTSFRVRARKLFYQNKSPSRLMGFYFGGDNRTRTCDPSHVKRMLYQLSHASK